MKWKFWGKEVVNEPAIGACQCGHLRCYHRDGTKTCNATFERDGKWFACACVQYIYSGSRGIVSLNVKADSEVEQLKKMAGIK